MGNNHPKAGSWSDTNNGICSICGFECEGFEYCNSIFGDNEKKKPYFSYHFTNTRTTFAINLGLSGKDEGGKGGGGADVGCTVTVEPGEPLVKGFRKEGGQGWMCVKCFATKNPSLFRDIAGSLYGKTYIINASDMTLVKPCIGAMGN